MKALAIIPIGLMTMLSSTPAVSHHDGRIDGALSTSLTGQAVFGPVKGNQSSSFSLELGAYSDNGAVVFSRVSSERPRAGTYRVTAFAPGAEKADEFHAMISLGSVGSPIGAFRAVSGTVTILQSTGDRIVGRYEVKAVGFLASDPENEGREITVRGGFSAEPAAEASRFEGAAHGAVEAVLQGEAEFGMVSDGAQERFALNLGTASAQGAVVLSRVGEVPAVGVYAVSPAGLLRRGDFSSVVITGSSAHPTGVFHATSGTVTITRSSADRISGTFELHATGLLAANPDDESKDVVVSGSFLATAHGSTITMSLR